MGSTGGRIAAAGAAAIVLGSLLPWTTIPLGGGYAYRGTMLSMSVFYDWDATGLAGSFLVSAGALTAQLGLACLAGVYFRQQWLTWLSGGFVTAALGALVARKGGFRVPCPDSRGGRRQSAARA